MSIKSPDSRIEMYGRELFITLDYLTNKTNEKKVACRTHVCKYAEENYGLKYDTKNEKGNQIDRNRVSDYLSLLYEMSKGYQGKFPFKIKKTKGDKYYIEEKNDLDSKSLIKLLTYIRNDKNISIKEEETFFKVLLKTFTNEIDSEKIRKEVNKQDRNVVKNTFSLDDKIALFYKALNEEKTIYVNHVFYDRTGEKEEIPRCYRVCKIKEYNHKAYAFLLPTSKTFKSKKGEITLFYNYIFDYIGNINIDDRYKSIDLDDYLEDDEPRNLDELFIKTNPQYKEYETIDNFIKSSKAPMWGGNNIRVAFYFNLNLLKYIKPVYENMFNEKLNYKKCSKFERKGLNGQIINIIDENNPTYGVVKSLIINERAFVSFLLTDPHGNGLVNIADMITLVEPNKISKYLESFYKRRYEKYKAINDDYMNIVKERRKK